MADERYDESTADIEAGAAARAPAGTAHLADLIRRGDAGGVETAVEALVGDRYRIERLAGSGGMGCVLAARDTVLQRRVAIKVVLRALDLEGAPRRRGPEHERILSEARAMAGLRHSNLCRVHEVSVDGPTPFIIMDWIDGIDLRAVWHGADLKHRLSVFVKIVDAVAAAHAAGVIHADLKPANVVVDRAGEPIIVDFGLARSFSASTNSRRIVGGTPGYAAPEQFDAAEPIGASADVYALGCMMYEMLTDRLPDPWRLGEGGCEEPPAQPETYAPGVPWPLQRICLVALEREPHRRYPDAHAMAADLQRYLRGESVAARPSWLAKEFFETVESHLEQVDCWLEQGAVTEAEANRLKRVLAGLLRPESHWILDSRRLTISQVTLYLGGWFALVALAVGLSFTGELGGIFPTDALGGYPEVRYIVAFAVAASLFGAGVLIQLRGRHRISLGYHITACLAVPAAVWLLFSETQWLGVPMVRTVHEMGAGGEPRIIERPAEWIAVFFGGHPSGDSGLLNRQLLVTLLAWLGASLGLRRLAFSSAFTPFAVLATALGVVAAWASAGLLAVFDDRNRDMALLGLWIFAVGLAALAPALRLNIREERRARALGMERARTRDSWSPLSASVLMIGVGLTLMAWFAGDLYTFHLIKDQPNDASARAAAFIINGLVLQALAYLLERHPTVARARLAEILRWATPSHVLAGLWVMQYEADRAWLFWLIVLAAASIATCYLSVWKQWRPFLLSGLFYVAVAYGRAFFEIAKRIDDQAAMDRSRVGLAAAMLVAGILTMIMAWKLPDWIAALRLERWSHD